jgi:hypothetical protein
LFFENGTFDYLFTTSLTRQLTLPEACPIGRPCHIYATLPENTSDSVFINYHTNILYKESNTCYTLESSGKETCFPTKVIAFDGVEKAGQRSVHSAYLYDMLPDTLYTIRIYYEDKLQAEEKYHTLPIDTTKRNVTIAMGGDAGFTELAYKTGKQAAQYKPDVIVLGGDIAYDNGMDTCYYTWDQFLGIFEYMNQVKGSLIPFIFSIGNHDSGVESLSLRTMKQDAYGPPYYTFFPQHSQTGANGEIIKEVPDVEERLSYSYHIVGGSLQFNLDSGYVAGYGGAQLEWMRTLTNKYTELPKFAYYHVPIYWVTGLWDPVAAGIVQGMQYWVPEFDRSKFMSVWENHSHLMKRTKPLKGGVPHENGTIYLGEGCWGALCYGLPLENSTGIFENYDSGINHFWLVQHGSEGVSYTAIDTNGVQLDVVHQNYETFGVKL